MFSCLFAPSRLFYALRKHLVESLDVCRDVAAKHGRTGNNDVRAGRDDIRRVVQLGAAVDLKLAVVAMLLDLCPSKVFINIGSNDMREWENGEDWMKHLLANYRTILTIARQELPLTAFYLMAYYPVNETFASLSPYHASMLKIRTNENVRHINRELARLADSFGQTYIDVSQGLTDESGALKKELTIDGIHMYSTAYRMIYQNLLPYICAEE